MSLLWLGSTSAGHGASTSEERTEKLKERVGREDPEPDQATGLTVGEPVEGAQQGAQGG